MGRMLVRVDALCESQDARGQPRVRVITLGHGRRLGAPTPPIHRRVTVMWALCPLAPRQLHILTLSRTFGEYCCKQRMHGLKHPQDITQ